MTRKAKQFDYEEDWERWLELFIFHKQAQGIAPRTIEDYKYHITLFFSKTNPKKRLSERITSYFAESSKLSPYTFNTRRKTLKAFFGWMEYENMIPENPMNEIAKRKEDETPKAIEEEILKQLLSLPDLSTFVGIRDYAIFLVTLDTGIRPGELFKLKEKYFDLKHLTITVPQTIAKNRVTRILPISPITAEAIKRVVINRDTAWDNIPVFCTELGEYITTSTWNKRLRKYSRILNHKITPYSLRHSFATIFLREGGDIFTLQRLLGHSTFEMTKRYLKITAKDVRQHHNQSTPLKKLVIKKKRIRKI